VLPHERAGDDLASGDVRTARFAHAEHNLLPFELAPARWREGIRTLIDSFPFEDNVFLMTRYPGADPEDPVAPVLDVAREVMSDHGLALHLASDRTLDPDLLGNVAAHMWACSLGVAVFEQRTEPRLNENLVAEVGAMLMTGRRVALLKDSSVGSFPTDFVGQIYREVDLDDPATVRDALTGWASEDLGRPPRGPA
jgi:hypothetical protein